MSRPGITYAEVAQAAAALVADGKAVTVDNVREALGSTGSKSTIGPLLKRWRGEMHEHEVELDLGLPPAFVQAMQTVFADLQQSVEERLRQAEEAFQADRARFAEEQQRCQSAQVELRQELEERGAALTRSQAAVASLEKSCHGQEVMLADLHSQKAGLEQHLQDRISVSEDLLRQLTEVRGQFEHYQEATAAQRQEERQSFAQRLQALELEAAQWRAQAVTHQKSLGELQAQLGALSATRDELRRTLALTERRAEQLEQERSQLRQERDLWAEQYRSASAAQQTLQQTHTALQTRLAESTSESRALLAAAAQERHDLATRLTKAEAEAARLTRENVALLQDKALLQGQLWQQQQQKQPQAPLASANRQTQS